MTDQPLNFESAKEREAWLLQNANYFTTVRMLNRRYARQEHKTLEEARTHAHLLLIQDGSKPVLIYAVKGDSSTYVEMIKP